MLVRINSSEKNAITIHDKVRFIGCNDAKIIVSYSENKEWKETVLFVKKLKISSVELYRKKGERGWWETIWRPKIN